MGQELVRSERIVRTFRAHRRAGPLLIALCIVAAACSKPAPPKRTSPVVPRMRVTVLVMHTNILPDRRAYTHLVMLAGDKVRLGDETDHWRLFDLKNETVTFVDAVAKTYRTEPAAKLIRDRLALVSSAASESVPPARFSAAAEERTLLGFRAKQHVIQAGPYRREIWMSSSTPIGNRFFAMLVASDPMSERYASMMRDVTRALLSLKGFPVFDRSDMPYDGATMTVERRVVKIVARDVPVAFMTIPVNYRNLTPNEPGVDRRSSSSRRRDRAARAGE